MIRRAALVLQTGALSFYSLEFVRVPHVISYKAYQQIADRFELPTL
jgi:hypothetical protein